MNLIYKEILKLLSSCEQVDDHKITAKLNFPKSFIGFRGHFEEKSVLSAACALEIVKVILEKTLNTRVTLTEIKEAKFFVPIGNSEDIYLTLTSEKSLKNVIVSNVISIKSLFEKTNEKSIILKLDFEIE
jgi:hypothetical protein